MLSAAITNGLAVECILSATPEGSLAILSLTRDGEPVTPAWVNGNTPAGYTAYLTASTAKLPPGETVTIALTGGDSESALITSTGSADIRIIAAHNQAEPIRLDGPPMKASIAQPGATATFTFNGTAGQRVSATMASATLDDTCSIAILRDPAGDFVESGCVIDGNGEIDAATLPSSGTYTLIVDPPDRATGSRLLRLTEDT